MDMLITYCLNNNSDEDCYKCCKYGYIENCPSNCKYFDCCGDTEKERERLWGDMEGEQNADRIGRC